MSTDRGGKNDSHQSPYENAVFVSYKWGGEGEEIVNQIEQALQTCEVKIIRDKRDLGYRGSIRKFMERVGQGNCVILILSDAYLRSQDCMFELVEIAKGKQFHDRVFPIVLGDADIYDPVKRIEYVRYWETKRSELATAMGTVDPANLQGIRDDIDLYDRIRDEISGLISIFKDMNTLTAEIHSQGNYQILADAICNRILSKDLVQQKKILDRRLDAAMPKECAVGRMTEVRVVIALPNSQGLRAFLPDHTESGELIDKGDVRIAGTPIDFPYDPYAGQYLSAHLYVKIDAPDFKIRKPLQRVLTPPDKDSGMITFFLTPRTSQPIGRVSIKLYQDKDRAITLGSVTLITKVSSKREENVEISWQLTKLPLPSVSTLTILGSGPLVGMPIDGQTGNAQQLESTRDIPLPTPTSNDEIQEEPVEMLDALANSASEPRLLRRGEWNVSPTVLAASLTGILGLAAAIIAALINVSPEILRMFINTTVTPTPTPLCMSPEDILVKVHILRTNNEEITTIIPGANLFIEPGLTVYFQVELISVHDIELPSPECAWTNTGRATDGKLLHDTGCKIDYQAGLEKITDAISLQLSQPSCSALPPYAFFIYSK